MHKTSEQFEQKLITTLIMYIFVIQHPILQSQILPNYFFSNFQVEQLIEDESLAAAYELIDHFCEYILTQLSYIRKNKYELLSSYLNLNQNTIAILQTSHNFSDGSTFQNQGLSK